MSCGNMATITTNPMAPATGFPEKKYTAGYFQSGTPLRDFMSKEWPGHSPRNLLSFRYVNGLVVEGVWKLLHPKAQGLSFSTPISVPKKIKYLFLGSSKCKQVKRGYEKLQEL